MRRYNLSLLMLMYALVARTAIDSVHCVTDLNGVLRQASNQRVVCWENEHHSFNGRLGWCTLILYSFGFPAFCMWLTSKAYWFNHEARLVETKERKEKIKQRSTKRKSTKSGNDGVEHVLPDGWTRHEDEEGRPYYETPSGEAQWAKPESTSNTSNTPSASMKRRKKQKNQRGSVHTDFMTKGQHAREKSQTVNHIQLPVEEEGNPCCRMNHLGTVRARQRSSVLRFVFHRPIVYIAYKPLVECDFHIAHLFFSPIYLVILFILSGKNKLYCLVSIC